MERGPRTRERRRDLAWVLAAAVVAIAWDVLVAASPRGFFRIAAPFCASWIALSARAAPDGLATALRPRALDVALGVATALVLYAGTRAFIAVFCGGLTDVLCAPTARMFARFHTQALAPGLALGLVIAPSEEVFWRGVVQPRLVRRVGVPGAVLAATGVAALLALATGEPFLALATLPTYAAWGALSAWRRSLVPALVSHALWSVLIASVAPPL